MHDHMSVNKCVYVASASIHGLDNRQGQDKGVV